MSEKRPLNKVSSRWLEETNAELLKLGISASERAEAAEKKWRQENVDDLMARVDEEFKTLHDHHEKQLDKIRAYFLTQSNKDRGYIHPPFVGIFYYHGEFWETVVPFVMGQRAINAFRYLNMPIELKKALAADKEMLDEFIGFYADCYDYGYSIEEIEGKGIAAFPLELIRSGDKHLRACGSLLAQPKASSKATEDARLAVEIFLKAYIVILESLTDDELRRQIGHRLDLAIDRCTGLGLNEIRNVRDAVLQLPDVGSRYEAQERTFGELWASYRLAHKVGITVLRPFTGRDCRRGFGLT